MTLQEAIDQLNLRSGEPDELDPTTAAGLALAQVFLNNALKIISTWKFPNGFRIRFRECDQHKIVRVPALLSGTVSSSPVFDSLLGGMPSSATPDAFAGWAVSVGGETRLAVSSNLANLTLATPLSSDPSGKAYEMSKSTFLFDGSAYNWNIPNLISVKSIYDLTQKISLPRGVAGETFVGSEDSMGVPSQWVAYGTGIKFDTAPDDAYAYRIEYFGYPLVGALADELPLPEAFHEALILAGLWQVYRMKEENTSVNTTWGQLSNLMITLRSSYDFDHETGDAKLNVKDRP